MSLAKRSLEPYRTDIPARLDRLPWSRFHWLVVLALGHLAGAIVVGRRVPTPRARSAGAAALSVSLAVGVVVLLRL